MKQPTHAGLWLVKGVRYTAHRNYAVRVNDLVDVQPVEFRRGNELAVYFFGKARPFNPNVFDATWEPVTIDFEGERSC